MDWISALKTGGIRELLHSGALQMGLFGERNLFELTHPDFPGERLIACRNPELAGMRAAKRQDLLLATTQELDKVKKMVEKGRITGRDKIGVRIGRVINKYKRGRTRRCARLPRTYLETARRHTASGRCWKNWLASSGTGVIASAPILPNRPS